MIDRPGERLKAARLAQKRKEDGQPWSQDNFLDAIAATGWRPAYKNYLDTERGGPKPVQPKATTWKKYVRFYAEHAPNKLDLNAIELPDPETEPAVPVMDVPTALLALAQAWEEERASLRREVDLLKATVNKLLAGTLAPGDRPAPATPPSPGQ